MPKTLRPITQSQYLITIAGVKAIFSQCTGGEEEFDTGEYTDPADRRRKTVRGTVMVNNITLAKPYNPEDDAALVNFWQTYRDNGTPEQITVTKQAIKNDKQKTQHGRPTTYHGCQIIRFVEPEADLESADAAMLEIELSADYLERA